MQRTRFTDQPPDADLLAALGVLRRPRGVGDVCPFTEPDWLPFLASVSVPYCRRLATGAAGAWHLVVGDASVESAARGSVAVVMHELRDQQSLAYGPVGAGQIRGPNLPTAAGPEHTAQLVPDGVHAVRLTFRSGDRVLAPVRDNLWAYAYAEGPGAADPFPSRVCWLDEGGQVVGLATE